MSSPVANKEDIVLCIGDELGRNNLVSEQSAKQ